MTTKDRSKYFEMREIVIQATKKSEPSEQTIKEAWDFANTMEVGSVDWIDLLFHIGIYSGKHISSKEQNRINSLTAYYESINDDILFGNDYEDDDY